MYIAVFQPSLLARDAYLSIGTGGSGQRINGYKLWLWGRRQSYFLGVGRSTRAHPKHGQSSQLRLVSVSDGPSTQLYSGSVFVRYLIVEGVGVLVLLSIFG